MPSLQDQLLKAGVVDKSKSQKIKKEKHKKKKQAPKGDAESNEAKRLAEQARAEKARKDKELNEKQKQQAERKAIEAQIKQLIETSRVDRSGGEIPYQFTHGKAIKKIYVTETLQTQLMNGQAAIVDLNGSYELVPTKVAEKIAQRDESKLVAVNEQSSNQVDEDDPYADYQIPDDLMW